MATSGSGTGARGGSSTGPYLKLTWSVNSQDTANNRSSVHLKLQLVSDYSINFSSSKTGVLQGTSYTYSGGMTSAGTVTVKELDVWVNHNSDGTLTTTFSGNLALNISWGGVSTGTLSVSVSATLDTIARASVPTLSVSTLDMGQTLTIYTHRASTAFTHYITYSWYNKSAVINTGVTDSTTFTVPLDFANDVPNATQSWGTIIVDTYDGSTKIGSNSVKFYANVPSTIVPTASGLIASISGSGRDKTLNMYIQNFTKIDASFTSAGASSSTITSNIITIKRQSDNADSQTINGNSGTTSNTVSLSGTYIVTATATDSRGRTATVSTTITVTAYSPPTITLFSVKRDATTTSNVNATINTSWSMAANNPTDVTVVGVDNVNTSTTLYTLSGSTAGSVNATQVYSSQSDASSYTYTITVTDSFGNVAKATATIGTSFVEFTIAKGQGVGIAKVWEQGALDIGGDVFTTGKLTVGINLYNTGGTAGIDMKNSDIIGANSIYFNDTAQSGEGLMFPKTGVTVGSTANTDYDNLRVLDGKLYLNDKAADTGIDSWGSNSNGWYVRYTDGMQFCWKNENYTSTSASAWTAVLVNGQYYIYIAGTWTFPAAFANTSDVSVFASGDIAGVMPETHTCFNPSFTQCSTESGGYKGGIDTAGSGLYRNWLAIGRWK